MGCCCTTFTDKYQECAFLLDELMLIIMKTASNDYTENEQKALNKYKFEKQDEIRTILDELEKNSTDELQKRKILKLKHEFIEILDENEDRKEAEEQSSE